MYAIYNVLHYLSLHLMQSFEYTIVQIWYMYVASKGHMIFNTYNTF